MLSYVYKKTDDTFPFLFVLFLLYLLFLLLPSSNFCKCYLSSLFCSLLNFFFLLTCSFTALVSPFFFIFLIFLLSPCQLLMQFFLFFCSLISLILFNQLQKKENVLYSVAFLLCLLPQNFYLLFELTYS